MCMTSAASKLSDTIIYVGEGTYKDKYVHVLAYQNNATNESSGPNAMILPFPTSEEMDENNIIDTSEFKYFLKDITNASKQRAFGSKLLGFNGNHAKSAWHSVAKVFDVGSYTVILAKNVNQIPEALTRVSENKRPKISNQFLEGFGKIYPNQPVAVCCFDGTIEAEPLLWWYVPKNEKVFFIPTMDAHDGNAPKLSEAVQTDHVISTGFLSNSENSVASEVNYTDRKIPDEIRSLLPTHVHGGKLGSKYKNGDMFINKENCSNKEHPKMIRGASFQEAEKNSLKFEMHGWA